MSTSGLGYRQHYLQIQALTPVQTTNPTHPTLPSSPVFSITYLPIFLFISVIVAGIYLSIKQKSSSLINTLKLALLVGIIPVSLAYLSSKVYIQSKASTQHTPQNITVTFSSPSTSVVTWQTHAKSLGAVQLTSSDGSLTTPSDNYHRTTNHKVFLSRLKPNQTYSIYIFSEGNWFDNQGQPIQLQTP